MSGSGSAITQIKILDDSTAEYTPPGPKIRLDIFTTIASNILLVIAFSAVRDFAGESALPEQITLKLLFPLRTCLPVLDDFALRLKTPIIALSIESCLLPVYCFNAVTGYGVFARLIARRTQLLRVGTGICLLVLGLLSYWVRDMYMSTLSLECLGGLLSLQFLVYAIIAQAKPQSAL